MDKKPKSLYEAYEANLYDLEKDLEFLLLQIDRDLLFEAITGAIALCESQKSVDQVKQFLVDMMKLRAKND